MEWYGRRRPRLVRPFHLHLVCANHPCHPCHALPASSPTPDRRRLSRHAGAAIVAGILVCSSGLITTAGAQDSIKDARQRRDEAREAQADVAAQIDVLKAEDAQLAAAMQAINSSVAAQQAKVDAATFALSQAEAEVSRRQAEIAATRTKISELRSTVSQMFVQEYVDHNQDSLAALLDARDLSVGIKRSALLDSIAIDRQRLTAELATLDADLSQSVDASKRAARDAENRRSSLVGQLASLKSRQAAEQRVRTELDRRIAESRRVQDQFQRDADQMTAYIKQEQAKLLGPGQAAFAASSVQGFVLPTAGRIGSGFGVRRHPVYGDLRSHTGVDIDGRSGDPIVAAKEGRVIFAGTRGGYGNCVIIQHGPSVTTVYAHLSAFDVRAGNSVTKGELIGRIGSTGVSTGPHLHFEVRVDGEAKDPMFFLP